MPFAAVRPNFGHVSSLVEAHQDTANLILKCLAVAKLGTSFELSKESVSCRFGPLSERAENVSNSLRMSGHCVNSGEGRHHYVAVRREGCMYKSQYKSQ